MKRNRILLIVISLLVSLAIGCSNKNIVLNENTMIEQVNDEDRLIVREKKFNLKINDDIGFEPCYITDNGVYGLSYVKDDESNGWPSRWADYNLTRVLEDGTLEKTGNKIRSYRGLPYIVEENEKLEIFYKNYLTGEEKKLMDKVRHNNSASFTSQSSSYIIENSPYAIIEETRKSTTTLNKTINIVNVNTGEIYSKNTEVEVDNNEDEVHQQLNEKYFYAGEDDIIYSLNNEDGIVKKLVLSNGKVEEEKYDELSHTYESDYFYGDIYSNGLETRIIYNEVNPSTSIIEAQVSYKVLTKEYEKLYELKGKTGNIINNVDMMANGLMLTVINQEYTLIRFDEQDIKLVYKFDFSDAISLSDEVIRDVRIVSDETGKNVLIKLIIVNLKTEETIEKFKFYELSI